MHANTESNVLRLERGEIVKLNSRRGFELSSIEGELWLTIDGERKDVVLGAGQSVKREGCHEVLVQALQPVQLRWSPSNTAPGAGQCRPRSVQGPLMSLLRAVARGARRPAAMAY